MRLSIKGLTLSCGLLWGGALLCVGLIRLASPSYAAEFVAEISSIYPGYHGGTGLGDVLLGAVYGVIDGALGGFFFGWLYNLFSGQSAQAQAAGK